MTPQSPLSIALRSVGLGETFEAGQDLSAHRKAGVYGLALGPLIFAAGVLVGTLLTNALLGAAQPAAGSVTVPTLVMGVIFGGALYGGLVSLAGTARVLESLSPGFRHPRTGALRLVFLLALVVEGGALLLGTLAIVIHLGIADFYIR